MVVVDLFGRGRLSFSDMLKNLSVARQTLLKKITAEPAVVWISSYKLQSARFKLEPHHCLFLWQVGKCAASAVEWDVCVGLLAFFCSPYLHSLQLLQEQFIAEVCFDVATSSTNGYTGRGL